MPDKAPLIDIEFALKQLSGNVQLLHRMLNKFAAEYEPAPKQVEQMLEQSDYKSAKRLIHTAKGITGNLGLLALYECCRSFDLEIKNLSIQADTVHKFTQLVRQTCDEIYALSFDDPQLNADGNVKQNNNAQQQLVGMIEREEFIDDNILRSLTAQLPLTESQKATLITMVEEMRFQDALELIAIKAN
ncbi:Hpt domain-containing protein [Glaciecola sp. XM2]|jgi:HPt (histidine-containing phosphotransfer) domain-containing protein|uniref:Hpt domain-containing protein n=1 Tax=Glaciecola sp. XM2 TaxID=1914931 RepID=UPI001BDEEBE8|nr:Hpt domain-containing protein [Glaciecola sp. XM2]MBT1450903.1 Hpt domain-containing protein [Glaciecola sp. XM2]